MKIKDRTSFWMAMTLLATHIAILSLTLGKGVTIGLMIAIVMLSIFPAIGAVVCLLKSMGWLDKE